MERLASLHGIRLRTGCLCNPGACAAALGLTPADIRCAPAASPLLHNLAPCLPTGCCPCVCGGGLHRVFELLLVLLNSVPAPRRKRRCL